MICSMYQTRKRLGAGEGANSEGDVGKISKMDEMRPAHILASEAGSACPLALKATVSPDWKAISIGKTESNEVDLLASETSRTQTKRMMNATRRAKYTKSDEETWCL